MAIGDRSALSGAIPEETVNEIVKNMPAASAVLPQVRVRTVRSKQSRVPIVSVLPDAGWVEELTNANADETGHVKPVTDYGIGSEFLNVEPLAAIVVIPDEVADDIRDGAGIDIWSEIRPELTAALGAKLDEAVLFGDSGTTSPASFPDGIVPQAVTATNTVTLGAGVDIAADINAAWALVESGGFDVNAQFAKRSLRATLRGLRGSDDTPIYLAGGLRADGGTASLYGESIAYVVNGAWTDDDTKVIVGDGSKCLVGIRQDMTWKILDQATVTVGANTINLAQSDAKALRVVMRCGFQVFNPPSREGSGFPFAV
ncbi:MAG: phage major capsid protein, partial [Microbacteriaceae bacterium]